MISFDFDFLNNKRYSFITSYCKPLIVSSSNYSNHK